MTDLNVYRIHYQGQRHGRAYGEALAAFVAPSEDEAIELALDLWMVDDDLDGANLAIEQIGDVHCGRYNPQRLTAGFLCAIY